MTFMKKISLFLLVLLLAVSYAPAAFSQEARLEPPFSPLRKLQRGGLNIALSPMEIAHWLSQEKTSPSFIPTWLTNSMKGSAFAVGRALTGVYEVVTFPLPLPAAYEPVVYPEFLWEHFEECSEELGAC